MTAHHEAYLSVAAALERIAKKDEVPPRFFYFTPAFEEQIGNPPLLVRETLTFEFHRQLSSEIGKALLNQLARAMKTQAETERNRLICEHEKILAKLKEGM